MNKENQYLKHLIDRLDATDQEGTQDQLREIRDVDPPRFAAGFASRVIDQLEAATGAQNLHQVLPKMFRWVAIGGVAAAIALLILTYYQQDSLSIDAMAGISDLSIVDDIDI